MIFQLVWALWMVHGGRVHGGTLSQPQPVAYFQTVEECERVRDTVTALSSRHGQCIQANYGVPK